MEIEAAVYHLAVQIKDILLPKTLISLKVTQQDTYFSKAVSPLKDIEWHWHNHVKVECSKQGLLHLADLAGGVAVFSDFHKAIF